MNEQQLKLECLKLAQSGSAKTTIDTAKEYYDWVSGGVTYVQSRTYGVAPVSDERPWVDDVTGRSYKKEADLKKAIAMRNRKK